MNKEEIIATLTTDATDAGYRIAAGQLLKLTQEPVVALVARYFGKEGDAEFGKKVVKFLRTEMGEAMFSSLLSLGLSQIPDTAGTIPQRLARELRVRSMTEVGDLLTDLFMGPIRDLITKGIVQASPEERKVYGLPTEAMLSMPRVRAEVGVSESVPLSGK